MINLNLYQAIELFNLQHGLYRPLEHFMSLSDIDDVLDLQFPLPIMLTTDEKTFNSLEQQEDLYFMGHKVGSISIEEKEKINIQQIALKLFGSKEHPGYSLFLKNHTDFLVSGKVNKK